MAPTVTPLTPIIGARIDGMHAAEPLSEADVALLGQAVVDHGVVFLPAQHLDDDAHQHLAGQLGSNHAHPVRELLGVADSIEVVHNDADKPPQDGSGWHTDYTFAERIPNIALLRSVVAPDVGGATQWASATAGYDALSDDVQARIAGLQGRHHIGEKFLFEIRRTLGDDIAAQVGDAFPERTHPLVIRHPNSGRPSLFVNPGYTVGISGMAADAAEALLEALYEAILKPAHICTWHWAAGDLAIWDERSTLHRGPNDFYPATRTLHRVTAGSYRPAGERPST